MFDTVVHADTLTVSKPCGHQFINQHGTISE